MSSSTKLLLVVFLAGCAGGAVMRGSAVALAQPEPPAPPPPPGMITFDYRISSMLGSATKENKEALLKRMGRQGWRFVGITQGYGEWQYIFEQTVEPTSPPPVFVPPPADGSKL